MTIKNELYYKTSDFNEEISLRYKNNLEIWINRKLFLTI